MGGNISNGRWDGINPIKSEEFNPGQNESIGGRLYEASQPDCKSYVLDIYTCFLAVDEEIDDLTS